MKRQDETPASSRTQSRDTAPWAERMLIEHWRSMLPWEKAALVSELSGALHRLSVAGLEARFPNAGPEEIERRAARLRLGPELMARFEQLRLES